MSPLALPPVPFFVLLGLCCFSLQNLRAQHHDHVDQATPDNTTFYDTLHDSLPIRSFKDVFTHGHVQGEGRFFFMGTRNGNDLRNYYANAAGGLLAYHTAFYKGFRFGVGGVFIYDLGSTDYPDTVGLENVLYGNYERELFDLQHPDNWNDLDRLEEFFLEYRRSHSYLILGKFGVNTPLMNRQDTRMKDYVLRGIWGEWNEFANMSLSLGFIDKASPRSITHWYSMKHAIGLYFNGYEVDGDRADYHRMDTRGMGVLGLEQEKLGPLKLQVWDYWLEGQLNTLHLQADLKKHAFGAYDFIGGLIYLRQDPLLSQDNRERSFYYHPNQTTNLLSARAGLARKGWDLSLNYTRIGSGGRFVFPREMGREQFYSTISRGRIEGLGDAHQAVLLTHWHPAKSKGFALKAGYGLTDTPGWDHPRLNKYRLGDYQHGVLDLAYTFEGLLEGLKIDLLYVYKSDLSEGPKINGPKMVNFHQLNLISNFSF